MSTIQNSGSVSYQTDLYSSNITETSLKSDSVSLELNISSSATPAHVGDTLTYTYTFTNNGEGLVTLGIFYTSIPLNLNYVTDSFVCTLDGAPLPVTAPSDNTDFEEGITFANDVIGEIQSLSEVVISFDTTIDNTPEIIPILNMGEISYEYQLNPSSSPLDMVTIKSSIIKVNFESTEYTLYQNNFWDRDYVPVGSILTYISSITNFGPATAENLQYTYTLPEHCEYIINSFRQNGIVNETVIIDSFASGITLSPVLPGTTSIISFKVKILSPP